MPRRFRMNIVFMLCVLLGMLTVNVVSSVAAAPPSAACDAAVDQLAQQVARLRERLASLEQEVMQLRQQIAQLRSASAGAAPAPSGEDELAQLRAELLAETEPTTPAAQETPAETRPASGALNLNRLNPEISVTGDLVGLYRPSAFSENVPAMEAEPISVAEPARSRFRLREIEVSMVSWLDPFSRMKVFLGIEDGEVDFEEAYVEWTSLPGNLRLALGRQYVQIGQLNRWHSHAYPQIDRPMAMDAFLGEEPLGQTGLHIAWLLPRLWSSASELVVTLGMGDAEGFRGNRLTRPAWLVFLNNYYDLSESMFFEFSLSTMQGLASDTPRLRHQIWNLAFRLNWTPPGRAKYRGFDLWGEVYYNRQQVIPPVPRPFNSPVTSPTPVRVPEWWNRWGGFVFTEWRLNRRWLVGARVDYVQRMDPDATRVWAFSPVVTFWQSEWVRLRLQYSLIRTLGVQPDTQHRLWVQLTWAAGPHKHEAY